MDMKELADWLRHLFAEISGIELNLMVACPGELAEEGHIGLMHLWGLRF